MVAKGTLACHTLFKNTLVYKEWQILMYEPITTIV